MALVIAGSVAARLWLLFERPLWFDEIFTVWAARLPLPELIRALMNDSGPPLFYVLEKPLIHLAERFDGPDVVARLLPWAATAALFAGALALPSPGPRRRFLMLAATSPLLLLYSAEARAYAVVALAGYLLFLLSLVAAERRERSIAIAVLSSALLYTHYLGIFVVAAVGVVALAERRYRSAVSLAGGAALFGFWTPILAAQPPAAVAWMREKPPELVAGILSSFGGGGRIPAPFGRPLPFGLFVAGVVIALAAAAGLGWTWRKDEGIRRAAAFLVLFLGAVLASSAVTPVGFAGRTEMAVLPVWMWAISLAAERSRALRGVAAAAVIVGAASSALVLASPRGPDASLSAIERLGTAARPGDVLFAGGHFYLPAALAADRGTLPLSVYPFPLDQAEHPGWAVAARPRAEDSELVRRAISAARPGDRVFFLVPPSFDEALRPILSERGVTVEVARTRELLVLVWSRAA